jgi:hypothetical protein
LEFIDSNENAQAGERDFSANNSSSAQADADDEDYDYSASYDLATHSATEPVAVAWDKWVETELQGRGIPMRRLMSLLIAFTFLASLAGCSCCGGRGHGFSQGMCDCESDDHCLERAPWLRFGASPSDGETIKTPPAKMPDGKSL